MRPLRYSSPLVVEQGQGRKGIWFSEKQYSEIRQLKCALHTSHELYGLLFYDLVRQSQECGRGAIIMAFLCLQGSSLEL